MKAKNSVKSTLIFGSKCANIGSKCACENIYKTLTHNSL